MRVSKNPYRLSWSPNIRSENHDYIVYVTVEEEITRVAKKGGTPAVFLP